MKRIVSPGLIIRLFSSTNDDFGPGGSTILQENYVESLKRAETSLNKEIKNLFSTII